MNKILLLILSPLLIFVACTRDEGVPVYSLQIANEACSPQYTTAIVQADFAAAQPSYKYKVYYSTSKDNAEGCVDMILEDGITYVGYIGNLKAKTSYYYWFAVEAPYSQLISHEVQSFQTFDYVKPTVITGDVRLVLSREAIGTAEVTDDGGLPILERGICYAATNQQPSIDDAHVVADYKDVGTYDCLLKPLKGRTEYYYCAYAKNSYGIAYGKVQSFTTLSEELAQVSTLQIIGVTSISAICLGSVSAPEDVLPHTCGFCYATSPEPTIADNAKSCPIEEGLLRTSIIGLVPNTTYYVRAFATNINGTTYGEQLTFTTLNQE